MPRRYRPEKRVVLPDEKYSSVNVSMFVNRLMQGGKKSVATRVLYDSFDVIEDRLKRPPLEVFEEALRNTMPAVEVRPRRVGGATYQVPLEVDARRQTALAMRWLLAAARKRGGRSMAEKLASEFIDASKEQGAAVKKRDDTHRMAESNRAFAHFRF